jgi:hypothetical protein
MRARLLAAWLLTTMSLLSSSCGEIGLVRQFEYEEELYLDLDGSASVVVNASLPALVALRGLSIDLAPDARLDRDELRKQFEGPGVRVTRVSRPWRRQGRRFVQLRLDVDDIRKLPAIAPFAWSTYDIDRRDGAFTYRQTVGPAANREVGNVGWSGSELVGFRLHLPSRIVFHNAPSREVERGNILSWEQPLRDRLAAAPLQMEVRMENQSILYRTLAIFGVAATAALALLAAAVWLVWRRGNAARVTDPGRRPAA